MIVLDQVIPAGITHGVLASWNESGGVGIGSVFVDRSNNQRFVFAANVVRHGICTFMNVDIACKFRSHCVTTFLSDQFASYRTLDSADLRVVDKPEYRLESIAVLPDRVNQ